MTSEHKWQSVTSIGSASVAPVSKREPIGWASRGNHRAKKMQPRLSDGMRHPVVIRKINKEN
jgi:hypothetical protein